MHLRLSITNPNVAMANNLPLGRIDPVHEMRLAYITTWVAYVQGTTGHRDAAQAEDEFVLLPARRLCALWFLSYSGRYFRSMSTPAFGPGLISTVTPDWSTRS